ncbi:MAG TPA: DNA repair protein RecO, partial [Thermoanaerobaculia bacterium]|nr:DNA repair protein RecO [Thermoanaerobaculia bacterium]
MRILSAEVLVLDVFDLHDDDRIVTFLTREQGKKRGVAKGARRKHSRFAGQLQPLAKARVTWFEREGRDLARVSSVELVRPAHRLQEDLEGILLGSYLVDHLLEFAQEDEASDAFFRLLDTTLEALLAGVDRDLAARYFEAWVLRLAGIFPPPRECPL